ncbi:DNA2/NAM7 helicase, putative [Plasmodium chabaudi chabaudi]|uniref:DNA2/NAM7 helicase, putative n=1 Tax=Plasmodium chabaudi chabaudi TaxID=31271 RepID=A0A1D3S019_PLACU|nr:DNA2/NAM7 helicase, putative [Plasmodium chabaudi chabaudi]
MLCEKMWERWDDEYFIKVFFNWDIFLKYAEDNEFHELEENIKNENIDLNKDEHENKTSDEVLLILQSYIIEKKNTYIDVSDYLVNIILRWNYYTSLRSENNLNICSVKNRLKIDININTLPSVYKSFEEYFYSYFPLFLIETQQLINNKKENESLKEFNINIIHDLKEMYNYEFHISIPFDELVFSNIFYGDLILLRFVPKKTEKHDLVFTSTHSSLKKKDDNPTDTQVENDIDNLEECSSNETDDEENEILSNKSLERCKSVEDKEETDTIGGGEKKENGDGSNVENAIQTIKKEEMNDKNNGNIYMVRKYCVRHLLGFVVGKNKEKIKIKFNLNFRNFDIIDKVRKSIIYDIFNKDQLNNYSLRISKVTNLISTLRQFNYLFNFRNSSIISEIIETQEGERRGSKKGTHTDTDENVEKSNHILSSNNLMTIKKRKCEDVTNEYTNEESGKIVKIKKTELSQIEDSKKRNNNLVEEDKELDQELVEEMELKEKIRNHLSREKILRYNFDEIKNEKVEENRVENFDKFETFETFETFEKFENFKMDVLENVNDQFEGFGYIPTLLKNKFFNIYNNCQLRAINNSILNDGVTLIQGPPGTGKTTTILGIISALIFYQKVEENKIENTDLVRKTNMDIKQTDEDDNNEEEELGWIVTSDKRETQKSPYGWINYDKKNDYCYFNENCFDALEYDDFFDNYPESRQMNKTSTFYFNKNNKKEYKNAYAIHLSIMNASSQVLNFGTNGDTNENENTNEEDKHKNNENRIKNLISLAETFHNSYVNNKEYTGTNLNTIEKDSKPNEKSSYPFYVSDRNRKFSKLSVEDDKKKMNIKKTKQIKNKKILVCAPSNAAIDEILRRLVSSDSGILDEDGNLFNPIVTRIGGNVSSDLLEFSLEFKEQLFLYLNKKDDNKIYKQNLLKTSTIICSTLSSSSNISLTNYINYFDAIIIDEASQAIELDILIPLSFSCKKIILVGDPKQLSATVFSLFAKKHNYSRSLFERLQKIYKFNKSKYNLLSIQYRMHPDISHFPNKHYYNNKIQDANYFLFVLLKELEIKKYTKQLLVDDDEKKKNMKYILTDLNLSKFIENQFGNLPPNFNDILLCQKNEENFHWFFIPLLQHCVFYDISFSKQKKIKNSYINIHESEIVLQFLEFLHYIFTSENVKEWYKKIGIITPYAAEKYFLKKALKVFFEKKGYKNNVSNFIDIGTVDGFQGTEKDIIIFVCVRTSGVFKRNEKKNKNNLTIENELANSSNNDMHINETKLEDNVESQSVYEQTESEGDEQMDDSNPFFSNYKRLNVALTRARYNLFIFGNCSFLNKCDAWSQIIEHYKINKKIIKIKKKKYLKKMKILSEDINEDHIFDNKNEIINKKIENSFYNKNIIDYNFIPINENENETFNLKDFINSFDKNSGKQNDLENNAYNEGDVNSKPNDKNGYLLEDNIKTYKEFDEKEINDFFKELYNDNFDKEDSISLQEKDEEQFDDENVVNDNGFKERKETFTNDLQMNIYNNEKKNVITTSSTVNNDLEQADTNPVVNNLTENNSVINNNSNGEDNVEKLKNDDKGLLNVTQDRNNILHIKNNNYFIDTLNNFCKKNTGLLFAVNCILPKFSNTFLH